jgi:hypothetical protein
MVFARQVRTTTTEPFRGRVFSPGTEVQMDFAYKHSRVKQYLILSSQREESLVA